jgi:hypothetical protein
MKSYVDALNASMVSNISTVANDHNNLDGALTNITTLFANAATQSSAIYTLQANVGAYYQYANANIGTATNNINTIKANLGAYQIYANAVFASAGTLSTLISNTSSFQSWANSTIGNTANSVSTLQANVGAYQLYANANIGAYQSYANAAITNIRTYANTLSTISNLKIQNYGTYANVELTNLANGLNQANSSISLIQANVTSANTKITGFTANLTTGPISITGNITSANVIVGNKIYFPDGTIQSTASLTPETGNIVFSGDTITTTGTDAGIILNSAGNGEIHLTDYTGVNNSNPGYWLQVGNNTNSFTTGNVAISFGNAEVYPGSAVDAVFTWDWADSLGRGTNPGVEHYNFGIYKNGSFNAPWITFNGATGNVVVGNITTSKLYSTTANVAGNLITANVSTGNLVATGTIVSVGNVTAGNVTATKVTATTASVTGNITVGNITVGNITVGNIAVNSIISTKVTAESFVANTFVANTFVSSGTGIPTISSTTNVNLSANNAVVVTQSLFRLANFTQEAVVDLIPQAGDMVYNTTYANIQIYTGTRWGNLTVN